MMMMMMMMMMMIFILLQFLAINVSSNISTLWYTIWDTYKFLRVSTPIYHHQGGIVTKVNKPTCLWIAHLPQQNHNSECVFFFREDFWRFWSAIIFYECKYDTAALRRRVFANCVMTLCLLKVHPQTFLSIPITQKMPKFWVVTL